MKKISQKAITRIRCLFLFLITVFCKGEGHEYDREVFTVGDVKFVPFGRVYGGYRDFVMSNPEVESMRTYGFTLNLDDKSQYIAPDGKILTRPYCERALFVCPIDYTGSFYADQYLDADNLTKYVGKLYIVDSVDGSYTGYDYPLPVFGTFACILSEVTSLRTPVYWQIEYFSTAINLKKIQIGTCHFIGPGAFLNCSKLETVIIEKSPYIYEGAFAKRNDLKEIVLLSSDELPLLENESVFEKSVYQNTTLYIPDNLMGECYKDPVWGKFVHKRSLSGCDVELVEP